MSQSDSIEKIKESMAHNTTQENEPTKDIITPAKTNDIKPKKQSFACEWITCKASAIIASVFGIAILILSSYLIATIAYNNKIANYLSQQKTYTVELKFPNKPQKGKLYPVEVLKPVTDLQADIASYKDLTDKKYDLLNSMLSNTLTIVGIILAIVTLIFGLFGFYLAAYINRKFDEISKLRVEVDTQANKVYNLTKHLDEKRREIDDLINQKNHYLYKVMEDHDTKLIIARLKESPESIIHVLPILMIREYENIWQEIYKCRTVYEESVQLASSDVSKHYALFLLANDSEKFFNSLDLMEEFVGKSSSPDIVKYVIQKINYLSNQQKNNLLNNITNIPDIYKENLTPFISDLLCAFSIISYLLAIDMVELQQILSKIYHTYGINPLNKLAEQLNQLKTVNSKNDKAIAKFDTIIEFIKQLEPAKENSATQTEAIK